MVEEDNIQEEIDLKKKIDQLRELVAGEKNLRVRQDDNFYTRFLYAGELDVNKAFNKLINFYKTKKQYADYFASGERAPESYKEFYSWGSGYILEQRDCKGKRILVGRMGFIRPSSTTMQQHAQFQDLFLETVLDEEETQKNGLSIIVDMKDYSWSLMRWLTPTNMKAVCAKIDCQPTVGWDYHIVNPSFLFYASLKLIYPFLSTKLKESIHVHGSNNWELLKEYIPSEGLPEEYGGKLHVDWEKMRQNFFENQEQLHTNLKLGYTDN